MKHIEIDLHHKYVMGSRDYGSDILLIPFHQITHVFVEKRYGTGGYVKVHAGHDIYVMQLVADFDDAVEFAKAIVIDINNSPHIVGIET